MEPRRTPEQIAADQEAWAAKNLAKHRAMKVKVIISVRNRYGGPKVHLLRLKSSPHESMCGKVSYGTVEVMTLGEIHDLPSHESCSLCWAGPPR